MTSVLPVCCTSADAGVCRALGCSLQGVVGATDGCAVGAVGTFTAAVGTACLAAAADGMLAGCSGTSTLECMSDLTASG